MSVISYAIDTFPAGRGQEAKQPLSTHQARLCGRQGYGVALASIVEEGLDELKRRGVDHGLRAFQGQPATVTLFGGVAQAGGGGAVVLAEEAAAWTQRYQAMQRGLEIAGSAADSLEHAHGLGACINNERLESAIKLHLGCTTASIHPMAGYLNKHAHDLLVTEVSFGGAAAVRACGTPVLFDHRPRDDRLLTAWGDEAQVDAHLLVVDGFVGAALGAHFAGCYLPAAEGGRLDGLGAGGGGKLAAAMRDWLIGLEGGEDILEAYRKRGGLPQPPSVAEGIAAAMAMEELVGRSYRMFEMPELYGEPASPLPPLAVAPTRAVQINLADMVHDVRLDLLQHGAGGADAVQRAAVERGEMLQHGGPHCDAAILIAAQQVHADAMQQLQPGSDLLRRAELVGETAMLMLDGVPGAAATLRARGQAMREALRAAQQAQQEEDEEEQAMEQEEGGEEEAAAASEAAEPEPAEYSSADEFVNP